MTGRNDETGDKVIEGTGRVAMVRTDGGGVEK
jgi:hypothetical protein